MKLKKYIALGMSVSSILLLTACDEDNETENGDEAESHEEVDDVQLEHVEESVSEVRALHETFVNGINNLYEEEVALQENFDQTLSDDDDLSTLADGSSPVFDNIASRQELLEQLEQAREDLLYHVDILERYEGDELGEADLTSHTQSFDSFVTQLDEYQTTYQGTLETQEAYFDDLSSDDATYDSFIEGIQSVNEERETLQNQLIDLDNALIEYNEDAEALQFIIDENTAGDEEADEGE